jgi:hypothetical protein
VQRKAAIQRKTNSALSTAPSSVENSLSSNRGKGRSLPEKVQHSMGSLWVRISAMYVFIKIMQPLT